MPSNICHHAASIAGCPPRSPHSPPPTSRRCPTCGLRLLGLSGIIRGSEGRDQVRPQCHVRLSRAHVQANPKLVASVPIATDCQPDFIGVIGPCMSLPHLPICVLWGLPQKEAKGRPAHDPKESAHEPARPMAHLSAQRLRCSAREGNAIKNETRRRPCQRCTRPVSTRARSADAETPVAGGLRASLTTLATPSRQCHPSDSKRRRRFCRNHAEKANTHRSWACTPPIIWRAARGKSRHPQRANPRNAAYPKQARDLRTTMPIHSCCGIVGTHGPPGAMQTLEQNVLHKHGTACT